MQSPTTEQVGAAFELIFGHRAHRNKNTIQGIFSTCRSVKDIHARRRRAYLIEPGRQEMLVEPVVAGLATLLFELQFQFYISEPALTKQRTIDQMRSFFQVLIAARARGRSQSAEN